ncbi:MAG: ABC transporter ATP-binding protein [Pseudomarimonas sp.]
MQKANLNRNTSSNSALAQLVGVSKRYGKTLALDNIHLTIQPAQVVALLGPNGAGKTTALALLTGAMRPDSGSVSLFGGDPTDWRVRRQIGVMQQSANLPETLRVAEHVRQFSGYYPNPRAVEQTLAMAGISDLAGRRYDALSGGQQRRVQFALAICGQPPLLFIDEPTVGLDVESRRGFWKVIAGLRAAGTSILLTTHYIEEADALADRIVLVGKGRVLAEDTPSGIKARASGKRVRCTSQLDVARLSHWPEVTSVTREGHTLELRSAVAEALLRRLLDADPQLTDIEVMPLSLEEALATLVTSESPTSASPALEHAA